MSVEDSRSDIVLRSMAFTVVGDLLLLCHSKAPPGDEEWDEWIERGRRGVHRGVLVSSAGGAPNSAQRARLSQMVNVMEAPPPFVLLTDSAMVRSVLTAFSWLLSSKQKLKALPPGEVAEALSWLGVSASPPRVHEALARLRGALEAASKSAP
jgi:hypothetical protein